MNTNEWITDRLPTAEDAPNTYECVWHKNEDGHVVQRFWGKVQLGEPWMRLQMPEPYVKPKRWTVCVYDEIGLVAVATYLPTREAAERIAAIYEEVMP